MRSLDADASTSPAGENCTSLIFSVCPIYRNALSCGLKFHIITVLSADPDANFVRFGLKLTDVTKFLCPRNVRSRHGFIMESVPTGLNSAIAMKVQVQPTFQSRLDYEIRSIMRADAVSNF